ncbi:NADH-quinone oxidoreductase subunit NuoE [Methanofollis aquaemaris]|uniref:NADH-quinone oxidoreductase subunit NuoE n=1 Tax=Methanofollis aquaemaris TaxID=126734 RepID=A0A8A3S7A5_9EURY|nr:NADH-quinone oxidoreductase subunit NuoE [Methanofollis aquaemaris]QSZ67554.1 NADH-quinone oxidoreductase subunit NuoE [Methanofollis aquaemaris]
MTEGVGDQTAVQEILGAYPRDPRHLLAALQDIQAEYSYLSVESMKEVARYLGVPESQVFSVATFYKALSLVPLGKKVIKVCTGTACHLRGAPRLVEAIEGALGIRDGETTADGVFTLQTVNCVGACAMAPVVVVNERVYGKVGIAQIPEMIETEREDEAEE